MRHFLKALSIVTLSAAASHCMAQNAHESSVKFMKGQQNAIVADYDLPGDVVENALKERLDKEGLGKKSSEKGFMAYKAVTWAGIGPDKMDIYVKVDGKDGKSTITLLASKGYDNFVTSANDADKVQKLEAFLNSFTNDAKAYQLKLAVAAQEEVIRKAEKDYKGSVEDGDKLSRDKEKLEKQIAENKNVQGKKETALSSEKGKLEELKKQM